MTLELYIKLIKDFAKQDPDLLHLDNVRDAVFSCSYEDAVSILSNIGDRMVLLIPPYSKHLRANQALGSVWIKECLVVAVQYVESEDHKGRTKIESKAERLLDRLYAYLYERLNNEPAYGLESSTWESDTIGPVGTNHYGYYAEFNIKDEVRY